MTRKRRMASDLSLWQNVWSWGAVGTIATFLLGSGVSFMTWSRPGLADVFIVGGAVLLLAKFLTWEETKTRPQFTRRRWVIAGVGFTTIVVVLAIVGNHYLNRARAVESSGDKNIRTRDESTVVFLNCEHLVKPVAWDNNTLYVIETFPNLTEGFVLIGSNTGKPRNWPEEQDFHSRTCECELTNYGTTPIFGLSTALNFTFAEALEVPDSPQARKSGAVVASQAHEIEVPALNSGGGRFIFYLHNQTSYFVNVTMPETGTAELSTSVERQPIKFKQAHSNKVLPLFLTPKVN